MLLCAQSSVVGGKVCSERMSNGAIRRIVVAITGATGAVYGVRVLEELRRVGNVETHVVISKAGLLSAATELDLGKRDIEALGLETFKLPFGHRGANHPVKDVRRGRVLVTVQNHGYAVKPAGDVEVSHISLNDGTVEGIAGPDFASVQFHPEAAPGPLDALPFFDRIAERCRSAKI